MNSLLDISVVCLTLRVHQAREIARVEEDAYDQQADCPDHASGEKREVVEQDQHRDQDYPDKILNKKEVDEMNGGNKAAIYTLITGVIVVATALLLC